MSSDTTSPATTKTPGRFGRLYQGLTTVDFVGRKKVWFTISIVVIVLGLGSLAIRGFNLGIDFKGGSSWEVLAPHSSISAMTSAVEQAGLPQPTVQKLGRDTYEVTADLNNLSSTRQNDINTAVIAAMAKTAGVGQNQVSMSSVGPTWGGQITQRAVEALIVFFIAVVAYISMRFEPKMALAAFAAMVHDLLVTVGVYSIFGFQITPDTVIAILTILGYSLYDTVVVFDRVRDNTATVLKSGDLTYADMVNLSMNQTLARSINTSLVAIMPVFSVLIVGAYILGATTLQNYGLALVVGLLSGAYSSIFIASPLLSMLKEREPRFRELTERVSSRVDRERLTPAAAAAMSGEGVQRTMPAKSAAATAGVQARARKQKRR
ncbi:MAG TPA: protein translocase subunit SecF [Acidimicrobiales bacterium]|nr:protein translocase subunit SecF [Acidimicrobiales bacterium]